MTKPVSVCPAANLCELTQLQGPACGSIPEHLSKIALPGTLCTRALWQQYEAVSQAALQASPGAFALQQAGLLIELGIGTSHQPAEADTYFANSKYLADLAANRMQNSASAYTTARLLSLFQPAYRAWGPHYWSADPVKTELQIGISALMNDVRELPVHSKELPLEHFLADDHTPCFTSGYSKRETYLDLAFFQVCLEADMGVIPAPRNDSMCDAFAAIDEKVIAVRLFHRSFRDELPTELAVVRFDKLIHRSNKPKGKYPVIKADWDGVIDKAASHLERKNKRISASNTDNTAPKSGINAVTHAMSLDLKRILRATISRSSEL